MAGLTSNVMRLGESGLLLSIPGILVPGVDQMTPLMPLFRRHKLRVVALEYSGDTFSAEVCVDDIVQNVYRACDQSSNVTVLASSLGGMLTALALEHLTNLPTDAVRWIISDAPSSGRDLVVGPLPDRVNSIFGRLSRLIRPSSTANHGYGRWLLNTMAVPPKDNAIELPPDLPVSMRAEYIEEQKRLAYVGLTSTPFTRWYQQVQWMLGCDDLLLAAFKRFTHTTYIASMRGNVTVRQPSAGIVWMPHMKRFETIQTAHCAYREAPFSTMKLLDQVMTESYSFV